MRRANHYNVQLVTETTPGRPPEVTMLGIHKEDKALRIAKRAAGRGAKWFGNETGGTGQGYKGPNGIAWVEPDRKAR